MCGSEKSAFASREFFGVDPCLFYLELEFEYDPVFTPHGRILFMEDHAFLQVEE